MVYQLTNDEKLTIINQHLRTLAFSRYNYEISLLEEQAASSPSSETLESINVQIGVLDAKINALVEETNALENQA